MKRAVNGVTLALAACLTLAVLILGALPAYAQVTTGSISGSIVDAQNNSVPNVAVKAINKATNEESNGSSDNAGLFRLNQLGTGTYRLEISKQGFRKLVFDSIDVTVAADHGLGALKLELGEVSSTIEVTEAQPLIQSSEAQITNAFTATNIATFPGVLENQGLDYLALTVPGIVNNRDLGFSNTNGPGFAVNGIRGRNNDQELDGQNNNDNSVGGPGLFVSDAEFVSEYQVITSNFSAEYGRNSGSVVNVITKSGTNTVHGSVYGTESNSALNALSNTQKAPLSAGFEGLTKPPRFNDEFTGGTIGGPLWTDHVFFFGGFDNEIVSQQQLYGSGLKTPTPAGIATMVGCYGNTASLQALSKYGPYGVGGGNPVPQGASLVKLPAFNFTPDGAAQPTNYAACPNVETGGVQRTLSTGSKAYNFPIKLDIQTEKNHFYGRFIYNKSTAYNTDAFGTAAAGYPASVPALSQDWRVSWVRTLSSRMTNEFSASYGRLNVGFGGNSIGNTVPVQQSLSSAMANVLFNGSSLLGFGPATNAPQGRIVNTDQVQDNWNYFRGRHSLKAGVNFTFQRSPNAFLPNENGQFRFADLGHFAADIPNRIRIASGNPNLDFREKDTFVYFGDDYKIKSNLTLNLGITWSYYGQPANLFHTNTVANATGANPVWLASLPQSVTTFPLIPSPKTSFAPSVGFAWTPGGGGKWLTGNGKTVVRGGYRIAYDPPFYNIYLNISSAAPNVLLNTLSGRVAAGGTLPSSLTLPAAPFGPAVRAELAGNLLKGVFDPRQFNETTITPDFGPQKAHEWSLGIQREIVPSAVFEARYIGNHAMNLFQSINANPAIAGLAALYPSLVPAGMTPCPASQAAVAAAVGRANCNLGVVRQRTNTGYSDYNGLQTEFRANQLWHQATIKAGYTWSKTTDNVSEIFATGAGGNTEAFSQSQVNYLGQEHGNSGIDFRHDFFVVFTEELPFFRAQHGLVGHVLGGWTVSGTYFLVSGQPYTASQAALNCGSGGGACSPNGPGNPYDAVFNGAFVGADGGLRPFLGSSSAPVQQVGIFTGDFYGCDGTVGNACPVGLTPTTLLSLNQLNIDGTNKVVTNKDVRFIANGLNSDAAFGTPFGNVGRNTLNDAWTNIVNLQVFKTFKVKEHFDVVWHMGMFNAFNHPNYNTVDPFIDDAGFATEGNGFANPSLTSGGLQNGTVGTPGRKIVFGLTFRW